jgi:hypothetical protein
MRTVLVTAVFYNWSIQQLDVNNAFMAPSLRLSTVASPWVSSI